MTEKLIRLNRREVQLTTFEKFSIDLPREVLMGLS